MIPDYLLPLYWDTKNLIEQHNINFIMEDNDEVILNDGEYNGYFIQNPPTFAVACKQAEDIWVPIFVHESCHMDQWIEKSSYWTTAHIDNIEALDIVNLWVNEHISLNDDQRKNICGKARDLELDCERRTVEKIKKYNLPFNIKEYIMKANAYIYFYNILSETRKWYETGEEPYLNDSIWKYMPDNFDGEYEMTPPEICKIFSPLFLKLEII